MPPPTVQPRLEVICGPMFAGKSTALLNRLRAAHVPFILFKPALDTRYAEAQVVTHAGDRLDAVAVGDPASIPGLARAFPVVGIDEAHFFGAALIPPVFELLGAGARVIVAGVERDHLGGPFEPFPRLLCEADAVDKLAARCARCDRPAVHSQRMVPGDARIIVGGAEAYEPRCRACFAAAHPPQG